MARTFVSFFRTCLRFEGSLAQPLPDRGKPSHCRIRKGKGWKGATEPISSRYLPPICKQVFVAGIMALFLQGCFYDSPLTAIPSRPLNTWLLGVWEYTDAKNNHYRAGIFPLDSTHYSVELRYISGPQKRFDVRQFKAYISRVDNMYFLNLFSVGQNPFNENGKSIFIVHYQLQSPGEVIVTPVALPVSGKSSPWKLRQKLRLLKKAGTLLPVENSTLWKKVSEVYWQKNASLASQPNFPLRIPVPNPDLPKMDSALTIGPGKSYQKNN